MCESTRVSSDMSPKLVVSLFLTLTACGATTHGPTYPAQALGIDVCARTPAYAEESTFFGSAEVQDATEIDLPAHGDLWPSCALGDTLFAAWGDGFGFGPRQQGRRPDIGVARLRGLPTTPASLEGVNLVTDRHDLQTTFRVWTRGHYYQKPTGMLCRGGLIFVAVQDLDAGSYNAAPAATIAVSRDAGATFRESPVPMFLGGVFTTIFFLDQGPDGRDAQDPYVYAYGLDFNWRGSPHAASPQALYLARIAPGKNLLDQREWELFAGEGGAVAWTSDMHSKKPVLVDCTRRHAAESPPGYPVIAQGGVVYDAPLARYLYTSWSEYTFELYEAPAPWGPWRRFLSKDFGLPPWTAAKHGGYGTSAPSLYISRDGRTLWLQSNTWSAGVDHNNLALRRLRLVPRDETRSEIATQR
jgi:hypothetical protein